MTKGFVSFLCYIVCVDDTGIKHMSWFILAELLVEHRTKPRGDLPLLPCLPRLGGRLISASVYHICKVDISLYMAHTSCTTFD